MAAIHKEIEIERSKEFVWDAIRNAGSIHKCLVPGFVVDCKLEGDSRIVTFTNGMVVRELIVGRARDAIKSNLAGPTAKDMPYTPYTDSTLHRLAALKSSTLTVMHGSSFRGDGEKALLDLTAVIKELLSTTQDGS